MENNREAQAAHWADQHAERIVRTRRTAEGSDAVYVCASGITPSGTVHIGNFREIISVDLVVRALRDRGSKVRFIYSWDDYDVFRKVPKNMPNQEMLTSYLRWPITKVPDPWGKTESYARYHELEVEQQIDKVGIRPEFLYQAKRYQSSEYAAQIRTALEKRDTIRAILDEFRSEPLPADWWPVSVFSSFTNKDTTTVLDWDGEWGLTYRCDETGKTETVDLRKTSVVKLPWRIDWPMRWAYEGVDFEPAGKEHHSAGGSFDTASKICGPVYGVEPPVTFKYDFISIKGRGGKISSSSGDVIDLGDMLKVYSPELVRYLFAGTRPNAEFAISFDLDVIKIYEDYDRTERIYFGLDEANGKKKEKESRIYELSQVDSPMTAQPLQLGFRHLCNLLLIMNRDFDKAIRTYPGVAALDAAGKLDARWWAYARNRAECAANWLADFAPEDFVFEVRSIDDPLPDFAAVVGDRDAAGASLAIGDLLALLGSEVYAAEEDKLLQDELYELARGRNLDPKDFFEILYILLVGQTRGPRLAGFLKTLGADRVRALLGPFGSTA